jgi:phage terminase small subunit
LARKLTPTVKCELCFERYKALSGHLKKHGSSVKKYREEFKDAPVISPLTKRRMQLARLRFILRKKGHINPKTETSLKLALKAKGRPHTEEREN